MLAEQRINNHSYTDDIHGVDTEATFPTLREIERLHVVRALRLAQGNKTKAALLLGISRMTLYRKLSELA